MGGGAVLFSNPHLPLVSFVTGMNGSANSRSISRPLQVRQFQVLTGLRPPLSPASGQHRLPVSPVLL